LRRLEGSQVPQLRDGIVGDPVQTDVKEGPHHVEPTRRGPRLGTDRGGAATDPGSAAFPYWYLTMRANSSGSRLAPPTSAPSMSGWAMKSRMLPALTLPPYWIRTAPATSVENTEARVSRIIPTTCPASAGSALRPVPM